jgi:dTDP-4-amino-4,6-dideoxygalactose transaminase
MISFNKPFVSNKEISYMNQVIANGKFSGNGNFTYMCQQFFREKFGFNHCLLTTSCTDALEMCALLTNIQLGDEVIVPSYTFVSTALAFVRQGAKIVFADSQRENPNMDVDTLEQLITAKTKAIVCVHYAGVSCDMDKIMSIAKQYNIFVIEDAAQAIDSYYISYQNGYKKSLGSIGHLSTFSFHETKNIHCGEGGLLVINDESLYHRAEIIWEKGTNRVEFFRGEINKYGWVDIGSSFLPSEYTAAFLYAQLQNLDMIQKRRKEIWVKYYEGLKDILAFRLPHIPSYATNNAHMFYIVCKSLAERGALINYLKENDVQAVFHYLSLHRSDFIKKRYINKEQDLPLSDYYTECLLRLPFYFELENKDIEKIMELIHIFYETKK